MTIPLMYKKKRGFTLVEALVASSIFLVILSIMYGIYASGLDIWGTGRYKAELQAAARLALERMVSELRQTTRTSTQNPSPNLTIPSVPNNKQVLFYLPQDKNGDGYITDANGNVEWDTNSQIRYRYVPGQKELRRDVGGEHIVLAQDVLDVQFFDITVDPTLAIDEVRINLTLEKMTPRQRRISVTLSSVVALRN